MPNGGPVKHRYVLMLALGVAAACSSPQSANNPAPPAASQAQPAAPGTRRADGSYLLYAFPVSKSGGLSYEVVLPPCAKPSCPVQVHLVDGDTVADTTVVDWPSVVETPQQSEEVAALPGVGDPLQLDRTVPTWQTGDGENAVSTTANAISIGSDANGVLVHQSGGAEHVKRLHYLFVANGRKLVAAWRGWEGQGLTSSTVDTMDVDNDGRAEILFWVFSSNDGVVTDWSLAVQRWNAGQARVDEVSSGGPPLFATVARTFPTAAAASKYLTDHRACLPSFFVIRSPAAGTTGFAAAGLSARASVAAAAAGAAKACDAAIDARTIDLGVRSQSAS